MRFIQTLSIAALAAAATFASAQPVDQGTKKHTDPAASATAASRGALKVGQKVEDFSIPNAQGKPTTLSKLLEQGPVVAIFYRGVWCPICTNQLRGFEAAIKDIEAEGAQLVAISPQTPDSTEATKKLVKGSYTFLADEGSEAARLFGVSYSVGDRFPLDLERFNGEGAAELPLGATFIIDTDRTIRYAFTDANYRKRVGPTDIIKALKDMKPKPAESAEIAAKQAINTGDSAPNFVLPAIGGGKVELELLTSSGPVVLIFFRGEWCPYCTNQLEEFENALDAIAEQGANLVAISPETPESSALAKKKSGASYFFLTDHDNKTARLYGISFNLSAETIDLYDNKYNINVPRSNGTDAWELPLGATYVIDTNNKVRYAYVDANYRERAKPADILGALDDIRSGR